MSVTRQKLPPRLEFDGRTGRIVNRRAEAADAESVYGPSVPLFLNLCACNALQTMACSTPYASWNSLGALPDQHNPEVTDD